MTSRAPSSRSSAPPPSSPRLGRIAFPPVGGRRKLVVVSNRGPVAYARSAEGKRIVRRGGGGLVTALAQPGRASRRDVDCERDERGGSSRRGRARRGVVRGDSARRLAVPPPPRRPRSVGVRLVLQRRRQPDPLVPAALHVEPAVHARPRPRPPQRLVQRLRARQRGVRSRDARRARARARRGGLLPRLPPLPCTEVRARAPAGRAHDALRAHPVASVRLLAHPAGAPAARGARRTAGERHRRVAHAPLAAQLPAQLRGRARRGGRLRARNRLARRPAHARDEPSDRNRPARVRRAEGRPGGARVRTRDRGEAAGVPRRARRPHRPVEERRSRLPRVRALPRLAPGAAGARDDARTARSVAPGHPGVLGVPRRDPARGASGQRPLPARRLRPDRPPDRRQLPAGAGGVQAVRRAARELGLRRAESRLEGGAADERTRRRAHPLRERGLVRRARGAGR